MLLKLNKLFERKLIVFAFIVVVTLIAYCNSFTAPFVLDDYGSITNNNAIRNLQDFAGFWEFYANRIVVYYTFAVNFAIHGTNVTDYHITNVALHIFNGFLVFLILYYLLGLKQFSHKLSGKYRNIVAALASLIFVCHPMQVNAVTYIVQRTASLSATFYFIAILFFIKFRLYDKIRYFIIMMIAIILAMFTKENAFTIPFMLLVIELMFFLKDGKTSWLKRLIVFEIIFLTLPIIPCTNILFNGHSYSDPYVSFKASTNMNRSHYFYTQMNVILLYIRLIFIPYKQNFDYSNDFPLSKTIWENYSYLSLTVLVLIVIFGIINIRKNKLVSLGIFWFFIGLVVESSFISIKDVYFEHRLYYPIAGFVVFFIGMIFYETHLFKRGFSLRKPWKTLNTKVKESYAIISFPGKRFRFASCRSYLLRKPLLFFVITCTLMTVFYTGLTIRRNYIYSDGIRLWQDTVLKCPESVRAHSSLAYEYLKLYEADKKENKELLEKSEKEYMKVIDLFAKDTTAYCNLARVFLLKKEYAKCIQEVNRINSFNKSEYAYYNMGEAYKGMGKNQDAIKAFLEGYKLNPKDTSILMALGNIYFEIKDFKNARTYYEEFLKYNINSEDKEILKKLKEIKIKEGGR